MSIYGYIHATTDTADHHTQHFGILAFASNNRLGQVHFCHGDKRILWGMVDNLQREDTLIVTDFSKLGDTITKILSNLSALSQRGVKLYVVKSGFRLDDNTQAQIVATACSLALQVENEMASGSTTEVPVPDQHEVEVLDSPAPRRMRRSRLDPRTEEIRSLLASGISLSEIGRLLGENRQTLTDFIKSRDLSAQSSPFPT